MIMGLHEGCKEEENKLFCIKQQSVVHFPVTNIERKTFMTTEFRPVECLYSKCAAYWCEEHNGCLEKCRHIHEAELYVDVDDDDDNTENSESLKN